MTPERAVRKLSVILSADVRGYSRLIGNGEMPTIDSLKAYRQVRSALVKRFSGRVIDFPRRQPFS
jgi:adenylate cyclase